ncbi:MAG: type II CRISPR-associated endonuclease Cas1 [Solirubrobacterales bacterium]|nr:type II CRISPR-associated endonuclease Cas1 [Solirubrobacterales bacterium]
MWGRIVELATDGRHARREHGFLVVVDRLDEDREVWRVALDDIEAVVVSGRSVSLSRSLLAHLAERNCPVVIADKNFLPVAMVIAVSGHHLQAKRFDAQIAAGLALRKRIWAVVVKAKIVQQGCVAAGVGSPSPRLAHLARSVRSGDFGNCEAQAARIYWKALFGDGFRRNREADGINAALNYGYTVLRAATARAVVAAGLHPTLGIHHRNQGNPMRLVDDLMEPYRPFVDLQVVALARQGTVELTTATKLLLVEVLSRDLVTDAIASPIGICLQRTASSLAEIYLGQTTALWLPKPQVPPEMVKETDLLSPKGAKC